MTKKTILFRDSTLREGLDVPGVRLAPQDKAEILNSLQALAVAEAEVVAPGHFDRDLKSIGALDRSRSKSLRISGLVFASHPDRTRQLQAARGVLDRVDVLVPLAAARPPASREEKQQLAQSAVEEGLRIFGEVGIGFPHASQAELPFLREICQAAAQTGARRLTLYDTNGSADPGSVTRMISEVRSAVSIPICFHAHNDLGLATANAFAAVLAGADALDVTLNGLGDRSGNASLEQLAVLLATRGFQTGLNLPGLRGACETASRLMQVPLSRLSPVVGEFAFCHKSPGHLKTPQLFEAFDPALIGASRTVRED